MQLSLEVNKQGQWTMKMAIKMFFSMSKIGGILLIFVIEKYKKKRDQLSWHIWITMYFVTKSRPNF
jgi:hypothetical protein